MSLSFFVICRQHDHDIVNWGKDGPRLYHTEKGAIRQAKIMNRREPIWGDENPHIPHLQEYKQHGPWFVRKVEF